MKPVKALSPAPRRGEFITRRLNGGLNYGFSFGLTASELRDGADFDISQSGAIGSRRPLTPFTTCNLNQRVVNSWTWQDVLRNDYIFIVMEDLSIRVAEPGDGCFVDSVFGTMSDGDSRCIPHAWSAGGWLYVSDGFRVWRWGGSAFMTYQVVTSVLVHPMSPTPEVTNLGVPPNCAATTYRDTVFIADTLVYETDPDAIWWSAPVAEQPDGSPLEGQLTGQEDFYENQRITFIAGSQSDRLNALVAAGPTLYAFKRHSIHVLSTNGSTVLTNDLSTNLGLAGPNAVAVQGGNVWFFDEHEGLHVISGNSQPVKVFDPIYPLLDCKRIAGCDHVAVGVDGDRVFVSCCLDGNGGPNNVTFVLNTAISSTSKGGAWSRWNVGFSSFIWWEPLIGDSSLVGFTTGPDEGGIFGAVRLNECATGVTDDWGFTTRTFRGWFETAFFDDGQPTLTKRWDRLALTTVGRGKLDLSVVAEAGPKGRLAETCERPVPVPAQPALLHDGTGEVVVDLTPYLTDSDTSIPVCDTDASGEKHQNGVVYPGTEIGAGTTVARVRRIASPGRGVYFGITVRDVASETDWTVEELDVKYAAIIEYT